MAIKIPEIDAYIGKAKAFAQPILKHIRKIVHASCPQVEEGLKWSFPNFSYKGKIMCSMAAFKEHCSFGFWLSSQMKTMDPFKKSKADNSQSGMGYFGKLSVLKDLPSEKELVKCIKEAMELIDKGVTLKKKLPPKNLEPVMPEYFSKALSKNKKAKEVFAAASPSFRKEYILWITEAKTQATRDKRLVTALEWIAGGKGRNWKYERK